MNLIRLFRFLVFVSVFNCLLNTSVLADEFLRACIGPEIKLTPGKTQGAWSCEVYGGWANSRFYVAIGLGTDGKSRVTIDEIKEWTPLDMFSQFDQNLYGGLATEFVLLRHITKPKEPPPSIKFGMGIIQQGPEYPPGFGWLVRSEIIKSYPFGNEDSPNWYTDGTLYTGIYFASEKLLGLRLMIGAGSNQRLDDSINRQKLELKFGLEHLQPDRIKARIDFWTRPFLKLKDIERVRLYFTWQEDMPSASEVEIRLPDQTSTKIKPIKEVIFKIGLEFNIF